MTTRWAAAAVSALKLREERKRDRCFDPKQRWLAIQEAIAWADQNMPPAKRRNRPRVRAS